MRNAKLLLCLLVIGLLLLNIYYLWMKVSNATNKRDCTSTAEGLRFPAAKTPKTQNRFVHNASVGYGSVKRMQSESLFHIHSETLMPLLRLTEAERSLEYRARLGRRWMRNQTVVFVGTARNAKAHMPRNVIDIHRLGKLFKDYWIVLVENDSNDGTREYLHGMRQAYNQTVILGCEPINSRKECHLGIVYRSGQLHRPGWAQKRSVAEKEDRSITMSVLRNMYLDYIYANLADTADLMIAIEPDISWDPWNLDSIAQGMYYFSTRPQLDTLCANGRLWGKIYDPCSRSYFHRKHFNVPDEDRKVADTTDAMALEKNSVPIKVDSCFQAFAAYRIGSLSREKLHYFPAPGEWNCEHNTLARQLRENYIDPAMMLNIYSLVVHSLDRW